MRPGHAPITLCGSLSLHPVAMGAAMHRAGYEALGLPFAYVPFAVERGELAQALAGMRALGIRGLGVSMPFKLDVLPLLDRLDPLAARIGAVNTIVHEPDGCLVGHNTDAEGAARALEERVGLRGARCLVLGAGGAGRAVTHGLVERGASVIVANRTRERAEELSRSTGAEVVDWAARERVDCEIVVNATSAGMDTGEGASLEPPISDDALARAKVVLDIVYKPLETPMVRRARARGVVAVHGGRMLLHQAARQFELYTGAQAPLEAMDEAIERHLR